MLPFSFADLCPGGILGKGLTMEKLKIGVVPVTAFQQNCALFWHEDTMEGVVFDPGGDAERIIAAIDQTGVKVQQVLLTHGHLDHVGAAMAVKEHFGVELVGPHKDDRDACERAESVATSYGLQGINNAYPDPNKKLHARLPHAPCLITTTGSEQLSSCSKLYAHLLQTPCLIPYFKYLRHKK